MAQLQLLFALAWHCALLSLFTVGGGVSMLFPQLHQWFIVQYRWVDERTFTELIAVAQASPGPNFLLIPLLGLRIASWPGLLVTLVAFLMFPVTITLWAGRALHQHGNEWVARLRRSVQPVTGGLWIASGIGVSIATDHGIASVCVTLTVTILALIFDISPLWWCLGAGVLGALIL